MLFEFKKSIVIFFLKKFELSSAHLAGIQFARFNSWYSCTRSKYQDILGTNFSV